MRMAIVARKDGEGAVVCKDGDGIEVIMLTTMIVLSLSLSLSLAQVHTHTCTLHTHTTHRDSLKAGWRQLEVLGVRDREKVGLEL